VALLDGRQQLGMGDRVEVTLPDGVDDDAPDVVDLEPSRLVPRHTKLAV
jgi:hypothetical protein